MKERLEALESAVQQLQRQLAEHESRLLHPSASAPALLSNGKLSVSGRLRAMDLNPNSSRTSPEPPAEVPMAATRVMITQLVTPADSNNHQVCTGGAILAWVDVCAGLAAKTLARGACVTASVDSVQFLRPCRVGSVVVLAGMVNRTFTSSMEVGVRVEAEDPITGARQHCCSAYLTFVTVTNNTSTAHRPLPRVIPTTRRHAAIYADAASRRQVRLEAREKLRKHPRLAQEEDARRLLPIHHRSNTTATTNGLESSGGSGNMTSAFGKGPSPFSLGGGFGQGDGINQQSATTAAGRMLAAMNTTTNNNTGDQDLAFLSPLRRVVFATDAAAHFVQIIMPQHANSIGVTFGGRVLQWMEQCAFIVAARVCRGASLLTAGLDGVTFKRPTKVGDTMYIEAQATAVFGSSVEVMISVWGESHNDSNGDPPFHCGDAFATIVAVDDAGEPVPIDCELRAETATDELRQCGASERREARLALRRHLRNRENQRPSLDEEMVLHSRASAEIVMTGRTSSEIVLTDKELEFGF